jgi:hypothetical protein
MFCPNCKYEYRPGFTRCSDCGADLVAELPADGSHAEGERSEDARTAVWEGTNQDTCVMLCRKLREAEIPYETARQEESRWFKRQNVWQYQILVGAEDSARALKLVEKLGFASGQPIGEQNSAAAEEESQADLEELPEEEYDESEEEDLEARVLAYNQPFITEDATEKISEEPDGEAASMIELALQENYIHCRLAPQESGPVEIFVLLDDAARAREIVREIHDASAP